MKELTRNPLFLKIVVDSLDAIKSDEDIDGVTLYEKYIQFWKEQEQSKHPHIPPSIKEELIEKLAHKMWQGSKKSRTFKQIISFIMNQVKSGKFVLQTGETPEEIARQLTTATFICRNTGKNSYVFAHTTVAEYFAANYMYKTLKNESIEDKDLEDNIREIMKVLRHNKPQKAKPDWIKNVFLTSSMGPSVRISLDS